MTPLPDLHTMCARLIAAHDAQPGIVEPDPLARAHTIVTPSVSFTVRAMPQSWIDMIAAEYRRLGPWAEDRHLNTGVDIDAVHHTVRPINSCQGFLDNSTPSPTIHVPAFLRIAP